MLKRGSALNQYSDLPAFFYEQDWIDETLREVWIDMIGFRNILVHDYLDVNREIVYDALQGRLDEVRELQAVFARFL